MNITRSTQVLQISNVVYNNAPKRRKHIVDRETETFDIINEFYEIENIHDRLNNLPEFCIRLGFLNQDFCDPKYYDDFSDKLVEEVLTESDSDSEDMMNLLMIHRLQKFIILF